MPTSKVPTLTEAGEYSEQSAIRVDCTQLGTRYTPAGARRVVADWIDLFSGGPTAVTDLQFVSRTPKRLFEALAGQTQLTRLIVKWGDYDDLAPLSALRALEHLELRGASAVSDVRPLAGLTRLRTLAIEGFRRIDDPLPLGHLTELIDLELGGAWATPRNAHVSSIGFLRELRSVQSLLLHTIIVDDRDYSPLLSMPSLRSVRVMETGGMRPSLDQLKLSLPWSA